MGEGASKLIILPNPCGYTLRTGAIFIAISHMIFSVCVILLDTVELSIPDKTKNMGKTYKLLNISLAGGFLSLIGAGMLLMGIHQYRRWMFMPYLVLSPISMILNWVVLGMAVPEVPVYVAVPIGMLSILGWYNWFIVLSYYGELKDEEEFQDEGEEGAGDDTETE